MITTVEVDKAAGWYSYGFPVVTYSEYPHTVERYWKIRGYLGECFDGFDLKASQITPWMVDKSCLEYPEIDCPDRYIPNFRSKQRYSLLPNGKQSGEFPFASWLSPGVRVYPNHWEYEVYPKGSLITGFAYGGDGKKSYEYAVFCSKTGYGGVDIQERIWSAATAGNRDSGRIITIHIRSVPDGFSIGVVGKPEVKEFYTGGILDALENTTKNMFSCQDFQLIPINQ